jgi:YfiH family protein
MLLVERSGSKLGVYPVLEILAPRLELYQSTRIGGYSEGPFDSLNIGLSVGDSKNRVGRNRRLLLDVTETSSRRLARAEQVHGSRIAVVDRGGLYEGFDGLITARTNLTLAVSTADCYPVIVYAVSEGTLAALHVGHGGATGDIIDKGIDSMRKCCEIDISNCIAAIGPGICWRCYEVGKELASKFEGRFCRIKGNRHHLDLRRFCREELERKGIPAGRIYESSYCTSCDREIFYSHRRDGGATGRHWTLARISDR